MNERPSPYIVCEELVKIYKIADLEVVALQGLELRVENGEMLALVGPSGSGKTTLMNILGGLDRPSAGKVTVNGQNLLKLSARDLDKYRQVEVGFFWQLPSRNLVPYLTVEQNVMLPMILSRVPEEESAERTSTLIESVGLRGREDHRLAELSGGEQQRTAIAVALANQPRLLLADEPTGEVDSQMAQQILETLRQLNRELGLTVIIVTHDPNIAQMVDRVLTIRDGKVSTEQLRDREKDHTESTSDELVVLDAAGRLQVPRDYLDELEIYDRARLKMVKEGILIQPVPNQTRPAGSHLQETEDMDQEDIDQAGTNQTDVFQIEENGALPQPRQGLLTSRLRALWRALLSREKTNDDNA